MRIVNVDGRLKLLVADGAVDVENASNGRIGSDPQLAYDRFDDLRRWAGDIDQPTEPFSPENAGAPAPSPRQVFAIGLNYRDHAAESGFAAPAVPVVFTKYPSSFSGPVSEVILPEGSVDWEVEVVAVIGKTARDVPNARGWEYVAGLTTGQDLSDEICSAADQRRSLGWRSRFPVFPRWVRLWSASMRSTGATTSGWVAPSTARRCRRVAPPT